VSPHHPGPLLPASPPAVREKREKVFCRSNPRPFGTFIETYISSMACGGFRPNGPGDFSPGLLCGQGLSSPEIRCPVLLSFSWSLFSRRRQPGWLVFRRGRQAPASFYSCGPKVQHQMPHSRTRRSPTSLKELPHLKARSRRDPALARARSTRSDFSPPSHRYRLFSSAPAGISPASK
jgi:hypothetical protein